MRFYVAAKIWHAPKFRQLRDELGFPVNARWIDLESDNPIVMYQKDILWQMCLEDVTQSDFLLLYCGDESEEQRGALVEIGMALAAGKPIYAIGHCKSIRPNSISDVAFTHHRLWTWLETDDLFQGTIQALAIELKKRVRHEINHQVA
jgi:nucleoside 2-deoxyribosyltransferase